MKLTKKQVSNICFFVGLVAVVVMFFTFDVSFVELWEHIKRARFWLIPILGVWLVIYAFNACAWQKIVNSSATRADERVGFWYIYKLTISGYALNYATPMGGMGGEPYRIVELSKRVGNHRATSSVVFYVMTHFFAHFLFWVLGVFVYLLLASLHKVPMDMWIAIVIAVTLAVSAGAFYLFSKGYSKGLVEKLLGFASRIPGLRNWSKKFVAKHGDSLQNIDQQIANIHRQDKRTFYTSIVLELVARILQSFEVMFMLILFDAGMTDSLSGLGLTFIYSMLIVAITTLLANIVGVLPMQIGVQEGGFVVSIALLGYEPALGIFVCVICRVREIFWILVGLVLMKIDSNQPPQLPYSKKVRYDLTNATNTAQVE